MWSGFFSSFLVGVAADYSWGVAGSMNQGSQPFAAEKVFSTSAFNAFCGSRSSHSSNECNRYVGSDQVRPWWLWGPNFGGMVLDAVGQLRWNFFHTRVQFYKMRIVVDTSHIRYGISIYVCLNFTHRVYYKMYIVPSVAIMSYEGSTFRSYNNWGHRTPESQICHLGRPPVARFLMVEADFAMGCGGCDCHWWGT